MSVPLATAAPQPASVAARAPVTGQDIIVVGAGLAGLSCALDLAMTRHRVLLLEAKPFVGGRTSSWTESDGMHVESGLHRVLGFYQAFPDLLQRAGLKVDDVIVWEDEVEFRQPLPAAPVVFSASLAHRAFRTLSGVFTGNDYLPPMAKASAAKLLALGLEDYAARPQELDRVTILEYAKRHDVHRKVIDHLLKPLTAGIFFIPAEHYSAYAFFGLIAPYLPNITKLSVGAFRGGMTEVMAQPLAEAIVREGGEVRTGITVRELWWKDGRVCGVLTEDGMMAARHVVVATPLAAAQRFVRRHWSEAAWCQPMLALRTMPAVTLQIELDAPSMNVDHTTFGVGTSLACFSEQSRTTFRELSGRLSIILTPAERFLDMPSEQVLEIALTDADQLDLQVRNHVRRYRVVKHLADFYALEPGQDALRPEQATPVPGLTLAGDYTRQIFLSTMEGAVVSGRRAAEHASASLGGMI